MGREKTQFKKGVSGNPKGKPPLPKEVLELRRLTRGDVELKVLRYKQMTQAELNKVIHDPLTRAEDILVCRVILKGISTGDATSLAFLTDFIFGSKPKEFRVDNVGNAPAQPQVIVMLPPKDV